MAHVRIIQRPKGSDSYTARYDVEKLIRVWWLGVWQRVAFFYSIEEAEECAKAVAQKKAIVEKVLKEYN